MVIQDEKPKVVNVSGDSKQYPVHVVDIGDNKDFTHLRGKTLEVYYLLVEHQGHKFGVREIQRTLGYSSPSIAAYHLNRLEANNLILSTTNGEYMIDRDPVKLGKLEDHVRIAGLMIPKILFYSYHAVSSIIIALIFFIIKADIGLWLTYGLLSNIVFLSLLIRDTRHISSKLKITD
jgi:hypothetical protein